MIDKENVQQEVLPAGVVTMLFAENKRIIDKQFYIMAGMLFANIGLIALLAYVLKGDLMRELLKSARVWMTESSRRSFYAVLQEAKITPRQMKICEMKFVDGKMNYQIAMELNISTKTVDREISTAYKAINRVLSK